MLFKIVGLAGFLKIVGLAGFLNINPETSLASYMRIERFLL